MAEIADTAATRERWTLHVRLERDDLDGGWVAECIDLPGCVSEGETQADAMRNMADAISEVLAARMSGNLPEFLDEDQSSPRELALSV